jgi:hypothetical protein
LNPSRRQSTSVLENPILLLKDRPIALREAHWQADHAEGASPRRERGGSDGRVASGAAVQIKALKKAAAQGIGRPKMLMPIEGQATAR